MAPAHSRHKKRIKIDAPFAAMPQALILDTQTSAGACRLWGVLFIFHWDDTPPDFDKLAAALGTTERTVYRWLQELESRRWITWDRNNKGMLDRFTLHMHPDVDGDDTGVNSDHGELIPRSKNLTQMSKQLTQRSEELTQVSISACFDPAPMPETNTPSSDQNHEKIQNVGDVGDQRTLTFLIDQNMSAAEEFAALPYDAMRLDYDNRRADRQSNGTIVRAWRLNPPTMEYHYGRERSGASNGTDSGRNGTGQTHRRTDSAHAARKPRPGDPAYYKRRAETRTDGTSDPE